MGPEYAHAQGLVVYEAHSTNLRVSFFKFSIQLYRNLSIKCHHLWKVFSSHIPVYMYSCIPVIGYDNISCSNYTSILRIDTWV